ncbi:MAG: hypothetical protein LCH95_23000 [Proteobacteria bacterium]|nr:hypothetical protein [Pseudomonadota bacterium]
MNELAKLTPLQLLELHASVGEELRKRGIVRSSNNPTADVAELLFCRAFGWQQALNSNVAADATDAQGVRYQIKGRRVTPQNPSRQLSALRGLDKGGFDFLAGIVFGADYKVLRAAILPHALVLQRSKFSSHQNGWIFHLRDSVWSLPGVRDVTAVLQSVVL